MFDYMLKFGGHILHRNTCPVSILLAKRCTVWPRAKIEKPFLSILGEIEKNGWQGKNPTKRLWKNCPWSWVPDTVEALQNGPGFFFGAWTQMFDHLWMNISKSLWIKKVQDSWPGTPFCRVEFVAIPCCRLEKRSQSHFVDKESSTLQNRPP